MTIDDLAAEIRRVDGNHSLGAGALAEALMPFILRALDEAKWRPIETAAVSIIETAPMKVGVLTRGRFGPTADEHASEVQTCIAEFVEVVYGKERYKTWHVKPCSPMRSGSWQPTHWMPLPTPPATNKDTQDE